MSKQCSEEKTWFPPMEPTWCAPSFRAMHICCNPVGVSTALHNAMPGHKAIDPAGSLSASELEWISKPGCQAPVQAVNCRTALKKVRGNRMMRKKKGNSSSLQNLLKRVSTPRELQKQPLHFEGALTHPESSLFPLGQRRLRRSAKEPVSVLPLHART